MVTLEYLLITTMTVCAGWGDGPAVEMEKFGVVVVALIKIQCVKNQKKNDFLTKFYKIILKYNIKLFILII